MMIEINQLGLVVPVEFSNSRKFQPSGTCIHQSNRARVLKTFEQPWDN